MSVLSRDNLQQHAKTHIAEYPLPYDPDTTVRLKSLPISRMNWVESEQAHGGERAQRAGLTMIQEAVLNGASDTETLWSSGEMPEIQRTNSRLILALLRMVGTHLGLKDTEIEALKKGLETDGEVTASGG